MVLLIMVWRHSFLRKGDYRHLQKKMLFLLEKETQGRHKDMSSLCPENFKFMPFMNIAVTVTISLLLDVIILSSAVKKAPNSL